jgi:hypothetical protein
VQRRLSLSTPDHILLVDDTPHEVCPEREAYYNPPSNLEG